MPNWSGVMLLRQNVLIAWLIVLLMAQVAPPLAAAVRIHAVQVGFTDAETEYSSGRFGHWVPVRVTVGVDGGESLRGSVWVMTTDADGIVNEVEAQPTLELAPGRSQQTVWAYVICGHGKLRIQVRDEFGRTRAAFTYPDDNSAAGLWQKIPARVLHVLAIGEPAGLGERNLPGKIGTGVVSGVDDPELGYWVTRIRQPEELPERWFGYDGVDAIVLATGGDEGGLWIKEFGRRPRLVQALKYWVQQGGHLVVTAAEHAEWLVQAERFPLAELLPGELAPGRSVYEEVLIGVRDVALSRYREATSLPALRCFFADFRKKSTAYQRAFGPERDKPAVLVWPYGLGQVTLVAFDTNTQAFKAWDGRVAFWEWLLETEPLPSRQSYRTALTQTIEEEPLTRLVHQLEQADAAEVPFALVAGLMLGYLLLAGPLDYLIVVRWLRRPVLAWFTFPLMVTVVCVLAWYSARGIHGQTLHVYQVDLYDLELGLVSPRQTQPPVLRGSGSTWLVVKSPRLSAFSLALDTSGSGSPEVSSTDKKLEEAVLGWAIRPDDDALRRGSRENLVQTAIRLQPGRGAVDNVPLQTWAVKTLFGRWVFRWDRAPVLAEMPLAAPDLNTLRGRITWRAPWPLRACELIYGNRVWLLGNLEPGRTVNIRRNDIGLLDRQRLGRSEPDAGRELLPGTVAESPAASEPDAGLDSFTLQIFDSLRQLSFQRLLIASSRQSISPYLPYLDQSRRLRYGQAVLVGIIPTREVQLEQMHQLPGLAASLSRLEPKIPGTLRRTVVVRIYLYPPVGE